MKRLLLFFFCLPVPLAAQLHIDFEAEGQTSWGQSRAGAWQVSTLDPLCGEASLQHAYDDSVAADSRISFPYDSLHTDGKTTTWSFSIQHGYNPSSSNKWAVFLLSEWDHERMHPGGNNRAILAGVNYTGRDDTLRIWSDEGGRINPICTTRLNWQEEIGTGAARLRIKREPPGSWKLYIISDDHGRGGLCGPVGEGDWIEIGSGQDTLGIPAGHFGIYYRYTSKQDQKLRIDNLHIDGLFIRDTIPPSIMSADALNDCRLRVLFSEIPDPDDALRCDNYHVPGNMSGPGMNPAKAVFVSEREVDLVFPEAFGSGQEQVLLVKDIADLKGNSMVMQEIGFLWYKPSRADIIFNEIMYDPDPAVGLPEREYAELYNRSVFSIDLLNWSLRIGNRSLAFPQLNLMPGTHLLLYWGYGTNAYNLAENSMGLGGAKTMLNNGGALLELFDADSVLIDWMEYSGSMHAGEYYARGGWSLERIDPDRPCHHPGNWMSSTNRNGGTPGRPNSVLGKNPDLFHPVIESVMPESPTSLHLVFNEAMNVPSVVDKDAWNVKPDAGSPDSVRVLPPWNRDAIMYFRTGFQAGREYYLECRKPLRDCSGNELQAGERMRFGLPVAPAALDVLVSEVLFDPLPYCPDFIELYNASSSVFNLAELCLATRDRETGGIGSVERIGVQRLFFPGAYIALTEDPEQLQRIFIRHDPGSMVKVSDLPTLEDDRGSVLVTDLQLGIIDEMDYDRDMHHPALHTVEGVSLERVSFSRASAHRSNWHSASSASGYGSPGLKNSQEIDPEASGEGIFTEPELFTPDLDGQDDALVIKYRFTDPGCRASIYIFDPRGRLVKEIARGVLLGTEGFYLWDGTDQAGRMARTGIYLVLAEISGNEGRVRKYRRPCVLSAGP